MKSLSKQATHPKSSFYLTLALFAALCCSAVHAQYVRTSPFWTSFGDQNGARYGSTIRLGDFDGDNSQDIAVAQPYYSPWIDKASRTNDRRNEGEVVVHFEPFADKNINPAAVPNAGGLRSISALWPSLPVAFQTSVTASYVINSAARTAALVSGTSVIRFNFVTGAITNAAVTYTSLFGGLPAAFQSGLDAILDNPKSSNLVFFRGANLIEVVRSSLSATGSVVAIGTRYPGLAALGFDSNLDEVIWGNNNKIYFVKGSAYVVWDVERSSLHSFETEELRKSLAFSPFAPKFANGIDACFVPTADPSLTAVSNANLNKFYCFRGSSVGLLPNRFLSNTRFGSLTGRTMTSGRPFPTAPRHDLSISCPHANRVITSNNANDNFNGRVFLFNGAEQGLTHNSSTNFQFQQCVGSSEQSNCFGSGGQMIGFAMDYGFSSTPTNVNLITVSGLTANDWRGRATVFPINNNGLLANPSNQQISQRYDPVSRTGVSILSRLDFDNDGKNDIILGAMKGDVPSDTSLPEYGGSVHFIRNGDVTRTFLTLSGPLFGSGFGFSLETADLNGDSRGDLLVGAPNWRAGRVYIYLNSATGLQTSSPAMFVDGLSSGEEFGYTITAIGDMNKDGRDDVVIGAPYFNDHEGRVYLYFGAATGLQATPAQIIRGQSVYGETIGRLSFGFAMAAFDVNGDTYPDLVIGSPSYNNSRGATTLLLTNLRADLSISAVPNANPVITPGTFSIVVTIANLGTDTSGPSVVTLDFVELLEVNTPVITLSAPITENVEASTAGVKVYNIAALASGVSTTISFNFGSLSDQIYPANADFTGSIVQTGTSTVDPNLDNNEFAMVFNFLTIADIGFVTVSQLEREDGSVTITQGDDIRIQTVTVRNYGPNTAFGVLLQFRLPTGVLRSSISLPSGVVCSGVTIVDCSLGNMLANAEITISNLVMTTRTFTSTDGVTIVLVSESNEPTPDTEHPNTYRTNDVIVDFVNANMRVVSVNGFPGTVNAGSALTVSATYLNEGPRTAGATQASILITGGYQLTNIATTGTFATCGSEIIGQSINITCVFSSFPSSTLATVTVSGTVPSSLPNGSTLNLAAAIYSTFPDLDWDNNYRLGTDVNVAVNTAFRLFFRRTTAAVNVAPGMSVGFSAVVQNLGSDSTSTSETITITLDDRFAETELDIASDCVKSISAGFLTAVCPVPALLSRASVTYDFTVGPIPQVITDSFNVEAATSIVDIDPQLLTVNMDTSANIVLTIRLPDGSTSIYTLTQNSYLPFNFAVRNVGPNPATNTKVTYIIPELSGLTYSSSNMDNGQSCTFDGDATIECVFGTLAKNELRSGFIRLFATENGIFDNEVTAVADQPDPISPNIAPFTLVIEETTDSALQLVRSAIVYIGGQFSVQATISNFGPGFARNTNFTLAYDENAFTLLIEDSETGDLVCAETLPGLLKCPVGTMNPGEEIRNLIFLFEVNADIASSTYQIVGEVKQSVIERSDTTDPNENNRVVLEIEPEFAYVDFQVTGTVSPRNFLADIGRNLSLSVVITNTGVVGDVSEVILEFWPENMELTDVIYSTSAEAPTSLISTCPSTMTGGFAAWSCELPSIDSSSAPISLLFIGVYIGNPVFGDAPVSVSVTGLNVIEKDSSDNTFTDTVSISQPQSAPAVSVNDSVPWWIILLGCVGGLLLVFIVGRQLKKRGFFNRRPPPPSIDQDVGDFSSSAEKSGVSQKEVEVSQE